MNQFGKVTGILLIVHYFCIKSTYSYCGDHDCISVVSEILQVAHTLHTAGQVLVSREWFLSVSELQLKRFHKENGVPWLVYGGNPQQHVIKNTTTASSRSSSRLAVNNNKFTSFKFAHLHHSSFSPSFTSQQFLNAQRQQTWRKLLYLTFRQGMRIHYSELDGSSSLPSRKAGLAAAWNTLIQKDLFIVTFNLVQLLDSVTSKQSFSDNNNHDLILSRNNNNRRVHWIWIGCSHPPSYYNHNIIQQAYSPLPTNYSQQLCIYSSRKGFTTLLGHISHCKHGALTMHIDRFHQLLVDHHRVGGGGGGTKKYTSPTKRLVDGEHEQQLIGLTGLEDQQQDILSSGITRRKIDPLSRKSFLYSSLVFITKKLPDSSGNTTSSVWGPFTIASWLGILAAYTVIAIVFAIIKIATMNNLENSWYDCIFSHLSSFMSEDNKVTMSHLRRKTVVASVGSSSIGIDLVDENEDDEVIKSSISAKHFLNVANNGCGGPHVFETRRISVKSLTVPVEQDNNNAKEHRCGAYRRSASVISSTEGNQGAFVQVKCGEQSRGKISRTILYGTIRVVSFILLAMYEGKLYNTITFPKSKLVATFDELISSDKYFVKVSSEAAKFENLTGQIKGNVTFRETPSGLVTTVKADGGGNKSAGAFYAGNEGRFVESVNILDCVNWVESGPDPNHACVGYEFELRNLHKAQKSDKILVRSKQRLLRFGSSGGAPSLMMTTGSGSTGTTASARFMSRRRGFTLFPGGFQISKWILESGILQLWSIVENAFMESVINPNWSDPFKVFTIRDYLGLFVVYSMLLILASIMFLLEHIVTVIKKIAKSKKVRRVVKSGWNKCKKCKCGGLKNTTFSCCNNNNWNLRGNKCCYSCYDNASIFSCGNIVWKMKENKPKLDRWRATKYFRTWSAINNNNRSVV